MSNNLVLTVSETAEILRSSEKLTRRLIIEGQIPALKLEGKYLILRNALELFLSNKDALYAPKSTNGNNHKGGAVEE